MPATKERSEGFADVIQKAKSIAEWRFANYDTAPYEPLNNEQLTVLVTELDKDAKSALNGSVEHYNGQLFSPMKYVIDWGEPNESELLDALREIELFYRMKY